MGFLYTFVKRFKPQYSLVVMTRASIGFWYWIINLVLHPILRLKNKGLVSYHLTLEMEMKGRDWEEEINNC